MQHLLIAFGVLNLIFTYFAFTSKQKYVIMLFLTFLNITIGTTYFLLGRNLGMWLVVIATTRTLMFFIYTKLNLKLNFEITIIYEVIILVISLLLFQDMLDIFIIVNMLLITYTSWQTNITVLKLGYLISSVLLICYNLAISAYFLVPSEIFNIAVILFFVIKYKNSVITKSLPEKYFQSMKDFFKTNVEIYKNHSIISSTATPDINYNFAVLNNFNNIVETLETCRADLKSKKLPLYAYIPFDSKQCDDRKNCAETLNITFPVAYHDVYMKLMSGYNLQKNVGKIKNIKYQVATSADTAGIMEVFAKSFYQTPASSLSGTNLKNYNNIKQFLSSAYEQNKNVTCYYAKLNNIYLSMLFIVKVKDVAYICKVGTIPSFRRKYVATNLIQFAINHQRKLNTQELYLITAKYSDQEKFYKFNNFEEILQAYCLDISDLENLKKYKELFLTQPNN